MIDLTGESNIKVLYDVDESTGFTTLSFMSSDESTMFGELQIESNKLDGFLNSLREMNKAFDVGPPHKVRTVFNFSQRKGTVTS